MRKTYLILARIIAIEVVIQAMAIVFGVAGLYNWIDGGATLDKSGLGEDGNASFTGDVGFMIHGINGQMVIPLLGLIFLIVSFFAKVPRGVMFAVVVFVSIIVQVVVGILGHDTPWVGPIHGLNAFILFGSAMAAAMAAKTPAEVTPAPAV
jgi:hypothetical protein